MGRVLFHELAKDKTRRGFKGMTVISRKELSRIVSNKSGISLKQTEAVLTALPKAIIDLLIKGYAVRITKLGTFYLRKISMPVYLKNQKKVSKRQDKYSLSFKRTLEASREINRKLLGDNYINELEFDD